MLVFVFSLVLVSMIVLLIIGSVKCFAEFVRIIFMLKIFKLLAWDSISDISILATEPENAISRLYLEKYERNNYKKFNKFIIYFLLLFSLEKSRLSFLFISVSDSFSIIYKLLLLLITYYYYYLFSITYCLLLI